MDFKRILTSKEELLTKVSNIEINHIDLILHSGLSDKLRSVIVSLNDIQDIKKILIESLQTDISFLKNLTE